MQTIQPTDYGSISKVTTGQLDTDPQLSPNESKIVYPVKMPRDETEYDTNIWVAPTNGDESKQLTTRHGEDTHPRWSPCGDQVAFLRETEEIGTQIWIIPINGGEARQLTHVIGGVDEFQWSPDGQRIAFTQSVTAEERERGIDLDGSEIDYEREPSDPQIITRTVYRVHDSFIDGKRGHVYSLDLTTEEVTRITDGDFDHLSPEWGDSSTLYFTTKQTGDPDDNYVQELFAYDMKTEREEHIKQFIFPASFPTSPGLAATTDGRIAFTVRDRERATMQQTDLHVHDRNTGKTTVLTEGFDRMVRRLARRPKWGPDEEILYFTAPDRGRIPILRMSGDGSEPPEHVFWDDAHHVTGFDVGRDQLVVAQSEWNHPGDIFRTDSDGTGIERLTEVNESYLAERAIAKPEEVHFENGSGETIQGYVLTPPGFDPSESYPLAVEIHGGPHYLWTTAGTMWHEFQCLAAAGYVVFWCNPRGSVGWGKEFMQAIYRNWGGPDYEDIMAGVDFVSEREYVDEENAFVIGGSYGGFLTSWIVGHTDRFQAAVTQRSVNDIAGMYGSSDGYKFLEDEFGTTPWEDHELLWEHSPAAYVDEVDTPTLVMHAEEDLRSPINTAEMFYRGLRKNDVETAFVRYPRDGHELSRAGEPQHVVDRLERIIRWINGYSNHHPEAPVLETDWQFETSVDKE